MTPKEKIAVYKYEKWLESQKDFSTPLSIFIAAYNMAIEDAAESACPVQEVIGMAVFSHVDKQSILKLKI